MSTQPERDDEDSAVLRRPGERCPGRESGEASFDLHPVIRLESPVSGAVLSGARLPLAGWILRSPRETAGTERAEQSTVSVVVELLNERTDLHAGMTVSGALARCEGPGRFRLIRLAVGRDERIIAGVDGTNRRSSSVEAEIELIDLVRTLPEHGALVSVSFAFESNGRLAVSNAARVVVLPTTRWPEPHCELALPKDRSLFIGDALLVEGYALRLDDHLERAEIKVNGAPVPAPAVNLESPAIADRFPSIAGARRARFASYLTHDDLAAAAPAVRSAGPRGTDLTVEVTARFASGAEVRIPGGRVRYVRAIDTLPREGSLHSIRELPNGELLLGGTFVRRSFLDGRLFLEGRRFRIEAVRDSGDPEAVGARYRFVPDLQHAVERPFLARADSGLEIRFTRDSLGPAPGLIRVVYEEAGERSVLTTPAFEERLAELVETGPIDRTKQRAAKVLCRMGWRDEPPPAATASRAEPVGDRPRLLVASHNLSLTEGAPKVLLDIISSGLKAGKLAPDAVTVVSFHDGPLRAALEGSGCRVELIPELRRDGLTFERFLGGLERAGRIAVSFAADRVLANVTDSFFAPILARRIGARSTWVVHESVDPRGAFGDLDPVLRFLYLEALRRADELVFVAESTARLFSPIRRDGRTVVIPNGIDVERYAEESKRMPRERARAELKIGDGEHVVSIIGTTTERKGQDRFLREMAILRSEHPDRMYRFLVVGAREIPFLATLRRMADELGLHEVTFVPETPDVVPYFMASDAIVIASREEAAPLVSLEAFAFGIPLISTAVFGLAEQLADGVNALIFDGDEPGALARQIARLQDDPGLRSSLIEGGRQSLRERFTARAMRDAYLELLTASGAA